jgi:hypothetical protein
VAGATPCPKNGVAGPPHFWPRGGRPPHTGHMGVAEATPGLWGWSGHPERPKKKKKKTKKMGLGFWGWPDHPQGPGGGFGHPLRPVGGVRSHPQALGGGLATPKGQNPFFRFFFFFGVAGHPQRPGVASATPIRPVCHPDFSLFFFFLFLISFFFSKKKKKKILKFAKLRRFRQNGVVLDK